jgi:hypothetical protein
MVSETGVPPLDFPIDGKDGVHGLYFGLSGETDPYLLRHYRYDSHGEFRQFKLIFRQTANDLYNDIPTDPPPDHLALDPFLNGDNVAPRMQNSIPVHFMMAADELADDAKEDTTVRPHVSPEAVRLELDQLVKPEDGSRLVGLYVLASNSVVNSSSHAQLLQLCVPGSTSRLTIPIRHHFFFPITVHCYFSKNTYPPSGCHLCIVPGFLCL